MSSQKAKVDRVFQALGDPTRRAILERLTKGPVSISQLAEPFQLTLAAVVQHIQVLEDSELVQSEKVGRVRTCRIEPKGFAVARQWLDDRRTLWEQRLDRLGEILGE